MLMQRRDNGQGALHEVAALFVLYAETAPSCGDGAVQAPFGRVVDALDAFLELQLLLGGWARTFPQKDLRLIRIIK